MRKLKLSQDEKKETEDDEDDKTSRSTTKTILKTTGGDKTPGKPLKKTGFSAPKKTPLSNVK